MHKPVLLKETLDLLAIGDGGAYVDATAGSGGHASAILDAAGKKGRLLAIDRDADALGRTAQTLEKFGERSVLRKGNFADIKVIAEEAGFAEADGIVMDLGVSSNQLDEGDRGFSFLRDGPLDMRMDRAAELTAETVVNDYPVEELVKIFRRFGEERQARRVAAAIEEARQTARIETTMVLAETIEKAKGGRRGKRIHPATKSFQAIRIEVNGELDSLSRGIESAISLLRPGGRLAIISFHSLEDREVKHRFKAHIGWFRSLEAGGAEPVRQDPAVSGVTKKPVTAGEEELNENPRARSAKLRVIERLNSGD